MSAPTYEGMRVETEAEKVRRVRGELPAVERIVYLNAGTNGPLPRRTVETLVQAAGVELEEGRVGQAASDRQTAVMNETRELMAEVLACAPEEVALTHNTTEGMNIALMGLDWRAGDEVVTANSEHEGGLNPLALLRARYGVRVIYTDIARCDCDPVEALERALSPRTRAVVLSHVSWSTGAVLPMRALCERAHAVGALVICDAAQACGMVQTRVRELGVDAYAVSGQKWLLGPDGTGALFVRRELLDEIQNTYTGYWGIKGRVTREETPVEFGETAQKYQYAAHYLPALAGWNAGLRWLRDEVGWEWVFTRTRALGQYAHEALAQLPGARMYLPREQVAGLVHFQIEGLAPAELTARLAKQGIVIRHTPEPELNRVATGFYNTEEEIERMVGGMRDEG